MDIRQSMESEYIKVEIAAVECQLEFGSDFAAKEYGMSFQASENELTQWLKELRKLI